MDSFERSRRSVPVPSGSVSYGRFVHYQNDCVYSIDKFRPRFPLKWQNLSVEQNGKVLALNDQTVLAAVKDTIQPLQTSLVRQDVGRLSGNLYWWSFDGVLITLQRFKPFGSDIPNYSILMELNPNKHLDNPVILDLIKRLKDLLGAYFVWHNTRMDYALDIPYPIADVRLLTRKIGSSYQGTYYFGQRGKSGYTRVYDKRKEQLEKARIDIGREVTRIEWESRSGDPVHMDLPFIIKDLGRHEVLRFVSMSDWPEALKCYDAHTAAKIRRNCLSMVDVDQTIFDRLASEFLTYLGLDQTTNHDHFERERLDAAAGEDLEKIQAWLRKFAKIED